MGRRRFGRRVNIKGRILSVLAVALTLYGTFVWNFTIAPNIDTISQMKAKSAISQAVNGVVREHFSDYTGDTALLLTQTNDNGEIEMVQANTMLINSLIGQLYFDLQEQYKETDAVITRVPVGSLLGNKVLSQGGPSVCLEILPLAVTGVDFRTEFESQGINQTKYKVYVILNTQARVLAPFSENEVTVSSVILVAETVIMGRVPESYVNVPSDDLLDGMNTGTAN